MLGTSVTTTSCSWAPQRYPKPCHAHGMPLGRHLGASGSPSLVASSSHQAAGAFQEVLVLLQPPALVRQQEKHGASAMDHLLKLAEIMPFPSFFLMFFPLFGIGSGAETGLKGKNSCRICRFGDATALTLWPAPAAGASSSPEPPSAAFQAPPESICSMSACTYWLLSSYPHLDTFFTCNARRLKAYFALKVSAPSLGLVLRPSPGCLRCSRHQFVGSWRSDSPPCGHNPHTSRCASAPVLSSPAPAIPSAKRLWVRCSCTSCDFNVASSARSSVSRRRWRSSVCFATYWS